MSRCFFTGAGFQPTEGQSDKDIQKHQEQEHHESKQQLEEKKRGTKYTWNPNDPCFDWKRPCFAGVDLQK